MENQAKAPTDEARAINKFDISDRNIDCVCKGTKKSPYIKELDDINGNENANMRFNFPYPAAMYPDGWNDFTKPPMYICGNDIVQEVVKVNERTGRAEREIQKREKTIAKLANGAEILNRLKIFDGYSNVPAFGRAYKWITPTANGHGAINLFNPLNYEPKEGEFPHINILLSQVFSENGLTLAYDYFSLAWQKPYQILPVLVLISKDNSTGKSTFLNFINWLFSGNAQILSDEDLTNAFNPYITSLFVMFDELQSGKKLINKIKTLATAQSMQLNIKCIQQCKVNTFMKVILAGNDIDNIISANKYDIRYWVRELAPIPPENWIKGFDRKLQNEIPAFAYFIANRQIVTPEESRMWFAPEILKTDALANIVKRSRSRCCQDILDFTNKYAIERSTKCVQATVKDIRNYLGTNIYSDNDVSGALRGELGLDNENTPKSYYNYMGNLSKGKYYTIPAELEDGEDGVSDDMPF